MKELKNVLKWLGESNNKKDTSERIWNKLKISPAGTTENLWRTPGEPPENRRKFPREPI